MSIISKIKSFFSLQKLEISTSFYNPHLEVVLENGQKLLNAANVNYSFGTLHKAFFEVLDGKGFFNKSYDKILVLGLGAGSIPNIFNQNSNVNLIIGLEIDEEVIRLGKKYFDIDKIKNLQIIIDDAQKYVQYSLLKFDLITIDLFIEEEIPKFVDEIEFMVLLKKLLNDNGMIIINRLEFNAITKESNQIFKENIDSVFTESEFYSVGMNKLLIVKK